MFRREGVGGEAGGKVGGVDVRGVPGDRPERREGVPRLGTRAAEGGRNHGAQHARDRLLDIGIGIRRRA